MSILNKNIVDSFDDLGYNNLNQLESYLSDLNYVNFSKLIHWLCDNLNRILPIESIVNEIDNEEDVNLLRIELSSLLNELGSPCSIDNLNDLNTKLTILNYLCGEMLAAAINSVKKSKNDEEFFESEIAKQLRLIMMNLAINEPPANVTIKQIFEKITECIDYEFKKRNIIIEKSILFKNNKNISSKLWTKLAELNEILREEYKIRRSTLITRSDCTCASFKWKKEHQNEELEHKIDEMYAKFNYLLKRDIEIDISDLMAIKLSDYNLLNNNVISKSHLSCDIIPPKTDQLANQGIQQRLSLHKFIIGQVPDRGGRTEEAIKPEQETFIQQRNLREQQKTNRGNFFNHGQRQNLNLDPNRIQGSGWNQYHGKNNWDNRNRNFTNDQSGEFQNKGYQRSNQRKNYQSEDNFNSASRNNQPRSGGYHQSGNWNDGGQYNQRRQNYYK